MPILYDPICGSFSTSRLHGQYHNHLRTFTGFRTHLKTPTPAVEALLYGKQAKSAFFIHIQSHVGWIKTHAVILYQHLDILPFPFDGYGCMGGFDDGGLMEVISMCSAKLVPPVSSGLMEINFINNSVKFTALNNEESRI